MRSLIEILVEAFSETKIFEMAYSREKYIDHIHSLTHQIIENWCLIKYCNIYDKENYNRLHWSKELIAHMSNLMQQKIKNGINKERTTKFALIEQEELNNPEVVKNIIEVKFDFENIETDLTLLANEFVKHLDKIIYLISKGNYSELKKYVYEEI